METNKVEVSKERLAELLRQEQELQLLENGGVANWEGYQYSLKPYDDITYYDILDMSDDEVIKKYL
jgi:hypothetical protein